MYKSCKHLPLVEGMGTKGWLCAGERRLHSAIPFLVGAGSLMAMAFFMDSDPSAAFVALLGATVVWGPAGVVYSLPATFLQASPSAKKVTLHCHNGLLFAMRAFCSCKTELLGASSGRALLRRLG